MIKLKDLMIKEGIIEEEPYSSPEAKKVMDTSVRQYAKILRKSEHKVLKDLFSKVKAGVVDYFDAINSLKTGDASRATSYEIDYLLSVITKGNIRDRFRSFTTGGGKLRKR